MKKTKISLLIIGISLLTFNYSVQAATLEDAKENALNGTGTMNVPHVPIDPKDKGDIGKESYELTPDEAKEYFSYIEKYQNINNYPGIPLEADVYINYISDKLKGSENKEITDSLRSEAENYVINYMQDSSTSNVKQDDSNKKVTEVKQDDSNKKVTEVKQDDSNKKVTKKVTKKTSLWTKFLNFLNM